MIARSLAVALATCVTLALAPAPAEAGNRRSGYDTDFNFVVGGHAFPYRRHARFFGPGVVVSPFVFPDGRVSLSYLRHGNIFATDYIGFIDYGRHGRVRGFYTYDGGYYDNSGRYFREYYPRDSRFRRYSYNDSYRRGYHYGNGHYARDGRYYRRYDDNYFGRDDRRDRRRDERDDRRDDRNDRRDDRYDYDDRDFRNEPYSGSGVPPGGIRSEEFPGNSGYRVPPSGDQRIPYTDDLDGRLDG
ncbi:MAG: hypothetical protein AAFR65_07360 [Pseudomonadota bacterium]